MRSTVSIWKGGTYLRITDYHPEFVKTVIMPFARRRLYRFGQVPIPGTRQKQKVVTHCFAKMNEDKSEFRISSGFYDEFVSFMQGVGYNTARIKVFEESVIKGKDVEFKWRPGWGEPRPHQEDWCKYQLEDGPVKVNNAQTGDGKEQAIDAPVLTPTGFVKMGDLQLGDSVISRDGSPTTVTGIFPQGVKKLFNITLEDGRVAEAGEEHLWKVFDCSRAVHIKDCSSRESERWQIIDTNEIMRKLKLYNPRLYLPLFEGHDYPEETHYLDPYLVGALLGDGCFAGNAIGFSKDCPELVSEIDRLLPGGYETCKVSSVDYTIRRIGGYSKERVVHVGGNEVKRCLDTLGLFGKRSYEKFIPEAYKRGTKEQRFALVQGMMDTDGYVNTRSTTSYSTTSEQLAKDFQEVIWSLGGIAKISDKETTYTHCGEKRKGRKAYVVSVRMPDPAKLFRKHPLKVERARKTQYSDTLKLRIKSVEFSREFEAQCIMVDHPEHLYVTSDYVVTHNTFMSIHTMVNTGKRTLITCLPRYVSIWLESLGGAVELNPEDIMLLEKGKLEETTLAIQEGRADPKIIILPLTRYDTHWRREKEEEIPNLDQIFTDWEIGLRIMDEAHEEIYRVYMSMLFGNFEKTIALSATLKADDPFINSIYKVVYPEIHRLKEPEYKQYIDVYAYYHYIDMQKYRINTKGFGGYSHVKYEQAIMKNEKLFKGYFELCDRAFNEFYLEGLQEGQKAIWFFSTVEMATRMKDAFQEKYPDMDMWKFTNKESKDKELRMSYAEHQVVFTTPQSCGTGKDIPKLFVAFSPYACSSRQRNDQMLGRTRPVDKFFPGLNPKFVYFVCKNIPKQVEYHNKRKDLFGVKSKSHTNINSFHFIN